MTELRIALVSRDADVRLAAARAFDAAPAHWSVALYESPPDDADVVVFGIDVGCDDGIVFDPTCPTRVLDDVARLASASRCRVVTIVGAAGGTGATTIALHLAQEWTTVRPTCVVELGSGGVAARLGLRDDARTWGDLGHSPESLWLSALPVSAGFRVLLSPRGARELDVVAVLERCATDFERVVVDAADEETRSDVLGRADAALLVMSPTRPCAERARGLLDAFPSAPWGIVVNRVGPGGETTRSELERIVRRKTALELPCAPALRDAEDDAVLLTSDWSRWRRRVRRLAEALHE